MMRSFWLGRFLRPSLGGCGSERRGSGTVGLIIGCRALNNRGMEAQLDQLRFDAKGLIPVIVQDVANGQVLMMAWMNREAMEKTLETGKVHTYSRSRGRLALKGEKSGHFQMVKQFLVDCDLD